MQAKPEPTLYPIPVSGLYGILMSDLRGFTAISEQFETLRLLPLLNFYFQKMTEVVSLHNGRVDKFMGDSVFALFDLEHNEDALYNMLSCSIDMQLAMDEVNQFGQTLELPEIFMGIGLNAGEVVACDLGSDIYRERTVLGEPVNVVSRMTAFALRGQVLMTEAVFKSYKDQVEIATDFNLLFKGKKKIIQIFELQGLLYPDRKTLPARENRKSPRVEAFLPISYHLIDNKRIDPYAIKAEITDISYGGMRIYTPQDHNLLDEIKIVVPFAIGEESSSDVYAKILSCTEESHQKFCISVEFSYLDEFARKSIRTLVDHLV